MNKDVIVCPECKFASYAELWVKAEWVHEGCPDCETYKFENTPTVKLEDLPVEVQNKVINLWEHHRKEDIC